MKSENSVQTVEDSVHLAHKGLSELSAIMQVMRFGVIGHGSDGPNDVDGAASCGLANSAADLGARISGIIAIAAQVKALVLTEKTVVEMPRDMQNTYRG